jgi:hypothetical protein
MGLATMAYNLRRVTNILGGAKVTVALQSTLSIQRNNTPLLSSLHRSGRFAADPPRLNLSSSVTTSVVGFFPYAGRSSCAGCTHQSKGAVLPFFAERGSRMSSDEVAHYAQNGFVRAAPSCLRRRHTPRHRQQVVQSVWFDARQTDKN